MHWDVKITFMKYTLLLLQQLLADVLFAVTTFPSKVWVADNGDGTNKSPVLHVLYYSPGEVKMFKQYPAGGLAPKWV